MGVIKRFKIAFFTKIYIFINTYQIAKKGLYSLKYKRKHGERKTKASLI